MNMVRAGSQCQIKSTKCHIISNRYVREGDPLKLGKGTRLREGTPLMLGKGIPPEVKEGDPTDVREGDPA